MSVHRLTSANTQLSTQQPAPTSWDEGSDINYGDGPSYYELVMSRLPKKPHEPLAMKAWSHFFNNMPVQGTWSNFEQFFENQFYLEQNLETERPKQVTLKSRYHCSVKNCVRSFTRMAELETHYAKKHKDQPH
jgi:hypothetical protein